MCKTSIFLKYFFLVYTTLHCQSTISKKFPDPAPDPDPTKKVRIRIRIRNPGNWSIYYNLTYVLLPGALPRQNHLNPWQPRVPTDHSGIYSRIF